VVDSSIAYTHFEVPRPTRVLSTTVSTVSPSRRELPGQTRGLDVAFTAAPYVIFVTAGLQILPSILLHL
jgi:hypothetical protein